MKRKCGIAIKSPSGTVFDRFSNSGSEFTYFLTGVIQMKQKAKQMLPYLIIITCLFYLVPLTIKDTGSAMQALLVVIPAGCFVTSLIYGIRHSFNGIFAVFVIVLFLPSIGIFYNFSAVFYCYIFGFLALLGNGLGAGIHWLIRKGRDSADADA